MAKNYDPKMHTAEHILNQTMVRLFNKGRSFSAHLEKKKSKCDYKFDRNLNDGEIIDIEKRVNEQIKKNLSVYEEYLNYEEAEKKVSLDKLPDNKSEKIRIVKVGDYDECPCIGEHVANTREIGTFKIISTDHNDGVLRIRFKLLDV